MLRLGKDRESGLRRIGTGLIAALSLLLFAAPALAQYDGGTVVIDGSGVHGQQNYGAGPSVSVNPSAVPQSGNVYGYGGSLPDRATKPFNTPQGPVMAPRDTSLPPHQARRGDSQRIHLRPPQQTVSRPPSAAPRKAVSAAPAAPRAPAKPVVTASPRPKAPAKPKPLAPKPVAKAVPAAPEKVERPARTAVAPRPAPQPKPATQSKPAPQPKPAAEPKPAPQPKAEPERKVATAAVAAAAPGVTRILFDGDAVDVPDAGRARLAEIARSVKGGKERVQVRAYADSDTETNDWKRRVSLRRAQTVRRVLLDNGVESFRILVRALGEPSDGGPGNRVDIEIASR